MDEEDVVGVAVLLHVATAEAHAQVVALLEEAVGFARVRDWDGPGSRGVILRATGGTDVEVVGPPDDTTWERRSRDVQLSVIVQDVEAWWDRLAADLRVTVVDPLTEQAFGVRSFGIAVTTGISLYVVERLPGNPARH